MSSAQVHDWLKERVPEIKVGESTVRSYVAELRREYEAVLHYVCDGAFAV
ncbi:hypothetical protein [Domibacillus iocasae]